jgi:hypothetical protein
MQTTRSTFNLLFYINTSKMKKSGKCPILGRISVDGENTAFSTGLEIVPAEWDSASGSANGKTGENADINWRIEKYKSETSGHYRHILESKGYVTAEILKNALNGIDAKHDSVVEEFIALAEEKRKSVGITIVYNTYKRFPVTIRHFKRFLKDRLNVDDIPFGKLNLEFIESFARYLKIDMGMKAWTVNGNIKLLRMLVKRALNRGWIRQDPFYGYTRERFVTCRRWLSRDELERIMQVEMEMESWNFTRDMFVFSCFTGICYADLYNLKHSDIQEQADGSFCIFLKRQKTGTAA